MRVETVFVTAFAIGLFAGCGGATVPTASIASTQAAIRAAEEVGADEVPQAALHLRYARDQFADAEELEEDGEEERAAMVLLRAEADAELAVALTRATLAEQDAEAAEREADRLDREQD